jgi:EKC/KEOPS complex subunit PCC1/LAGE3
LPRVYRATTVRILRLCTNAFLSSLDLVQQTIATFDPALPQLSDEELAEQARIANSGNVKGIELRGDGKGAGSGEEIKA